MMNVKEFNDAVKDDNYAKLLDIISRPEFGINSELYSNCCPLAYAITHNKPELVEVFLQMKANPNTRRADGTPLLHYALSQGYYECAIKLLNDPRTKDYYRLATGTALHVAARRGEQAGVDILLAHGADPLAHGSDKIWGFPYEVAKKVGHSDLSVYLQKQSSSLINALRQRFPKRKNPDTLPAEERTAYEKVQQMHQDTAKLHYPLMGENPHFYLEEIEAAINNKDANRFRQLINAGVVYDCTIANDMFETPLDKACANGSLEIVRMLCELGSDFSREGVNGSAVAIALKNGHQDIADFLNDFKRDQVEIFEQFVEQKQNRLDNA